MKSFFKTRMEKLKNELKIADLLKHSPTDKATLREDYFRQFIKDLFPYYNAFKGNINEKSCDFILADNEHPNFNSTLDYYHGVFLNFVDTVIDLKGNVSKKEFNAGWNQSFSVKSKIRENRSRDVVQSFNVNSDYLEKLSVKHGIVFIKGKLDKVLKFLAEKISPLEIEKINYSISRKEKIYLELNKKNVEYFYKSPDFYYSIEQNEIIFFDKKRVLFSPKIKNIKQKKYLGILKIEGDRALTILMSLLERYSNIRDNMKMRQNYQWEFKNQNVLNFWDYKIICEFSPEIEWFLEKVENKFEIKNATLDKLINLLKLKN